MSLAIKCPNCGTEIQLDEVMESQYKDEVSRELKHQLEEQLKVKTIEIESKAAKKADEAAGLKLKELEEAIVEKDAKLEEINKERLEIAKRERALKDKEAEIEIEMEKRLAVQTEAIRKQEKEKADAENRFKDIEKEKQLKMFQEQIEQLKRQIEQGSQQMQGEVQEIELKEILQRNFAIDIIEDVKTGARGADIVQKVRNSFGMECGTILWECKRAKAWAGEWPEKLKSDQRKIGAEISVIYTSVLPKDINGFGLHEGVWVTGYQHLIPLTSALRIQLEQVALANKSNENVQDKAQLVYRYIASPLFRQKVSAIVDAFTTLKKDLESERNAMQRIWKKREKSIDTVFSGVVGIYGEIQGMAGNEVGEIDSLELENISVDDLDD